MTNANVWPAEAGKQSKLEQEALVVPLQKDRKHLYLLSTLKQLSWCHSLLWKPSAVTHWLPLSHWMHQKCQSAFQSHCLCLVHGTWSRLVSAPSLGWQMLSACAQLAHWLLVPPTSFWKPQKSCSTTQPCTHWCIYTDAVCYACVLLERQACTVGRFARLKIYLLKQSLRVDLDMSTSSNDHSIHSMHASHDNLNNCSIAVQQVVNSKLHIHMVHVDVQLLWLLRWQDCITIWPLLLWDYSKHHKPYSNFL